MFYRNPLPLTYNQESILPSCIIFLILPNSKSIKEVNECSFSAETVKKTMRMFSQKTLLSQKTIENSTCRNSKTFTQPYPSSNLIKMSIKCRQTHFLGLTFIPQTQLLVFIIRIKKVTCVQFWISRTNNFLTPQYLQATAKKRMPFQN